MKYIFYILSIIMGLISSLLVLIYIKRVDLEYNSEGLSFSLEKGVVYHKQAKEVYGILAFLGFIMAGMLIISYQKRKTLKTNITEE